MIRLIVDEVDAFPYVDNPMLYHAVHQAVKVEGTKIFLTATSTDELDKKVAKGELTRLSLPRRFHGKILFDCSSKNLVGRFSKISWSKEASS